ncbi:hypothetical protein PoB_001526900 [Plakobranchus ocellatus]|uniref:Uncharacterized protein n=1 Tax=Plakobranchus ocellatus TaxID=259542 RepID=A0AAV3Z441_9GAST|nr:hypothetical protein PoB_001526900 [Plakobranchus ocellatus]
MILETNHHCNFLASNTCPRARLKMSFKLPEDFHESEESQLDEDQQNEEIFLIRTPKKFDITQLNGVEYIPGQIKDFAVDDSLPGQLSATYQLAASNIQDFDLKPLIKRKGKVVVGRSLDGHLSVTKSYSVECKPSPYTLPNFQNPRPSLVPMPEGLKVRFTPFGSGTPSTVHRSHKHHKGHKRSRESVPLSPDETTQKAKRRKKGKEVEPNSFVENAGLRHSDSGQNSSLLSSTDSTNTASNSSANWASPEKQRKKNKKEKRHKKEETVGDWVPQVQNNFLSTMSFSMPVESQDVPNSNSGKNKKKGKSVSFSLEDSIFMDSSGDASHLTKGETPPRLSESIHHTVNGESETSEKLIKKQKQALSSGYSSIESSFELSPTSNNSFKKKKKKKHKHRPDESP